MSSTTTTTVRTVEMLRTWLASQNELRGHGMKDSSIFYRNIEEALDLRRTEHSFVTIVKNNWKFSGATDFCSNDLLGLGASGLLRKEFNTELQRYPNMPLGAGASRIFDGNYGYLDMVEQEIADFHGAETGLIVSSGFEANGAIYQSIPRPGDVVVYDELVHASTHEGLKNSNCMASESFRHNNVVDLQNVLSRVLADHPMICQSKRSILIAVESIYSMDGEFCPLVEMINAVKEMFPAGNCQFIVNEAHSIGVIGPNERGYVCELGVEHEIAVRLHTFGKALGSTGAIILTNQTIKSALVNFSRSAIYTTAPSFSTVAGISAAYNILKSGKTQLPQEQIQSLVMLFFNLITGNPVFKSAVQRKILSIPLALEWESQPIQSHMVAVHVKDRKCLWLFFHLLLANLTTTPVTFPTVPLGSNRLRITFHSSNTEAEVVRLVGSICEWAQEMLEIEEDGAKRSGVEAMPRAARQVY
ncbi:putative aminotransferase, partial [Massarina eburnea CBS 473.64]